MDVQITHFMEWTLRALYLNTLLSNNFDGRRTNGIDISI